MKGIDEHNARAHTQKHIYTENTVHTDDDEENSVPVFGVYLDRKNGMIKPKGKKASNHTERS